MAVAPHGGSHNRLVACMAAVLLAIAAAPVAVQAQTCESYVSVSPWDDGNHFPAVTLCCGGSVNFQWSGSTGVYQISSGTCPAAFSNTTAGQKELLPVTQGSGGVKALYFAVPGTFWLTSQAPGGCASGLLFKVLVPPGSGSVCPATSPSPTPPPVPVPSPSPSPSPSGGPAAFAAGPPGETSTSTSQNGAAAASGPSAMTASTPTYSGSLAGRRMMGSAGELA